MKKEIKYFLLIVFGLCLGVTIYNTLGNSAKTQLSQAAQFISNHSEKQEFSFPQYWMGSAKLSRLLGAELSGFVEFKSDQNGEVLVLHNVGIEDQAQIPVESIEENDQNIIIKWMTGFDAYEFQVYKGQKNADLYVTRDEVRYLVMMDVFEGHLLDEELSTASRFMDNIRAVLLEGWELLFPRWIALIVAYAFVAGLMYLIFWKLMKNVLSKKKIQNKMPRKGSVSFEVKHSLIAALAIGFFSYLLVWVIESGHSRLYREISDYG